MFQLVILSRTREDLYTLLGLTHVCRFWRILLIHYPPAWTTIFAMEGDRRSFVEMCLKRSRPLPLEVTVGTSNQQWVYTGCTCDEGERPGRFLPNKQTPCEWHFSFEPLTHSDNSKRIQVLNVNSSSGRFLQVPELESSWVFDLPLPRVTTPTWKNGETREAECLFSTPHALPNLQSVTIEGSWNHSLIYVNNLTSFTIKNLAWLLDAEKLRLFLLNNRSLESLEISTEIESITRGPPVDLLNLKSLCIDCDRSPWGLSWDLSPVLRVPALQRLSALQIFLEDELGGLHTLRATGDGISLSMKSKAPNVASNWQRLTEYARPTIHHVCVYDKQPANTVPYDYISAPITALMVDAHTVEIGLTYSWYRDGEFWAELKRLGSQLKTVRFEVSEKVEPFRGSNYSDSESESPFCVNHILEKVEDLVKCRFREGRPLSTVERMVTSEDKRVNQLQDDVWTRFFSGRDIWKHLASG